MLNYYLAGLDAPFHLVAQDGSPAALAYGLALPRGGKRGRVQHGLAAARTRGCQSRWCSSLGTTKTSRTANEVAFVFSLWRSLLVIRTTYGLTLTGARIGLRLAHGFTVCRPRLMICTFSRYDTLCANRKSILSESFVSNFFIRGCLGK
jgi:hypothetical protein